MEEAPTPPIVELRDIYLEFEEKKVLQGVSLVVEPLDRLVIMGQSGSGKSTILRLILGILPLSPKYVRSCFLTETPQTPADPHPDRDGLSILGAPQFAQRPR